MVFSYSLLRDLRYLEYHKYILGMFILIGIMLPDISESSEREVDLQSEVKINVISFIYTLDSGLDEQVRSKQQIERSVIFPAIEETFRELDISNYSLKFEPVNSGNVDYTVSAPKFQALSEEQRGLNLWGMVRPVDWPLNYDLTLVYYINAKPLYQADLEIRDKMIVKWNQYECRLPITSLGMMSGVLALKFGDQTDGNANRIESLVDSRKYTLPAEVKNLLLKSSTSRASTGTAHQGVLTLWLENGSKYLFGVDQSYYQQLNTYLAAGKKTSWILDQGGLLMPEIKFNGKVEEQVAVGPDYRSLDTGIQRPRIINIGVVPFTNKTGSKETDWLGFGIDYLLNNKFSKISAYKVFDQEAVIKFTRGDSATVDVDGVPLSMNYSISGSYALNGDMLEIDVSIAQAFNDVLIATDHFKIGYRELFDVIDLTADKFNRITGVYQTAEEADRSRGRVTGSLEAFRNFCMGYIENSASNPDTDAVIRYFTTAIRLDPAFWGAYYNLGTVYFNIGMYEQARSRFDYIIENFPSFELAYLGRGLTQMLNKSYHNALVDFSIYMEKRPRDYRGWYYGGRCALQIRDYTRALEYFTQVTELQPMFARGYYELGNVYYATNRFAPAILNYNQALDLEPDLLEARKRLGESYYRLHNFIRAFDQFKQILVIDPNDPEANFMIGITIYKRAALDEYIDEFLELYGLLNREEIANNKKKYDVKKQRIYDQMIRCFYTAQNARDNFYEATFNLALTYQEMGQLDSAQYYYTKTLRINPNLAKARIVLAQFYQNQSKYEQALEEYKMAARIDPGYFVDYSKLGPEYGEVDILDLVKSELEQEIRIDPNNITSSLSLANILYSQGFSGKAAVLYRKILSLRPEEKTAKKMLARIDD